MACAVPQDDGYPLQRIDKHASTSFELQLAILYLCKMQVAAHVYAYLPHAMHTTSSFANFRIHRIHNIVIKIGSKNSQNCDKVSFQLGLTTRGVNQPV